VYNLNWRYLLGETESFELETQTDLFCHTLRQGEYESMLESVCGFVHKIHHCIWLQGLWEIITCTKWKQHSKNKRMSGTNLNLEWVHREYKSTTLSEPTLPSNIHIYISHILSKNIWNKYHIFYMCIYPFMILTTEQRWGRRNYSRSGNCNRNHSWITSMIS
jgi:hypothetical protein